MESVQPLKVGLIGVGNHTSQVLLPAMEQLPETLRIVALATEHEDTARAAGALHRLPWHVGHEALIADPNVEAVIMATHGPTHEAHAIAALEAGKPVFTETPGIVTVAGAKRIRELTRTRKLTFLVGSCLRYAPPYRRLLQLLQEWRAAEPGPRTFYVSYYPAAAHIHNMLLYLNGEIKSVLVLKASDGKSTITLVRFANGDIGSVRVTGFHNPSPPNELVEVTHMTGKLAVEDGHIVRFHRTPAKAAAPGTELTFEHAAGELYHPTYSMPYAGNAQLFMRGYVPELADFARCVRTGDAPLCGVDDAEKTLMVGQAVGRAAAAEGQWIEVAKGSWAE